MARCPPPRCRAEPGCSIASSPRAQRHPRCRCPRDPASRDRRGPPMARCPPPRCRADSGRPIASSPKAQRHPRCRCPRDPASRDRRGPPTARCRPRRCWTDTALATASSPRVTTGPQCPARRCPGPAVDRSKAARARPRMQPPCHQVAVPPEHPFPRAPRCPTQDCRRGSAAANPSVPTAGPGA